MQMTYITHYLQHHSLTIHIYFATMNIEKRRYQTTNGSPQKFIWLKITAKLLAGLGGYFCGLSLLPIAYPRPKAVKIRLTTAMNPSSVIISNTLFHVNFPCKHKIFIIDRGSQPSEGGRTAYRFR